MSNIPYNYQNYDIIIKRPHNVSIISATLFKKTTGLNSNMELTIKPYDSNFEKQWDSFIEKESLNGTFLQSRNFLNYHPKERFKDHSLVVLKGTNSIIALIPACEIEEDNKKVLYSHMGSTFGGIIVNQNSYNIKHIEEIIKKLESYCIDNKFNEIILKNSSALFCKDRMDLIDYFLFKNNYNYYDELSFYVDCKKLPEDILSAFSSGRRRDYRYSLKNNLVFKKLELDDEITDFYNLLLGNLKKFDKKPVHSLGEILEFKNIRLTDIVDFYGAYHQNSMLAGTMVFKFYKQVFHTQYLASDQTKLSLFPMEFLNTNLIRVAKEQGYDYFSFGISTEDHGKVLNEGLALFKEGFGASYCINRTYKKKL